MSGECFSSDRLLDAIARQVKAIGKRGTAVAVVPGGGNILRGRDASMDRVAADRAGMLATVVNGIRLTELLAPATHLAARGMPGIVEGYTVEKGRAALSRGGVLVASGGTGNPFFSTDSAAALRAAELGADAILKGTNVAGVYSADPKKDPKAKLFRRLSYRRALELRLAVMDLTAFALCMDRRIPIHVFDISRPRAIMEIIQGKRIGSHIC